MGKLYVHTDIYIFIYVNVHTYIYMYILKDRSRYSALYFSEDSTIPCFHGVF